MNKEVPSPPPLPNATAQKNRYNQRNTPQTRRHTLHIAKYASQCDTYNK